MHSRRAVCFGVAVLALVACTKIGPGKDPVVYLAVDVTPEREAAFLDAVKRFAEQERFTTLISGKIGPNQDQRAFELTRSDMHVSGSNPFHEGFKVAVYASDSSATATKAQIGAVATVFARVLSIAEFDVREIGGVPERR
jgi:hypothetical protein